MTDSFDNEQLCSFTNDLKGLDVQISVQTEQLTTLISRKKN